jgi:hypothetical protein
VPSEVHWGLVASVVALLFVIWLMLRGDGKR